MRLAFLFVSAAMLGHSACADSWPGIVQRAYLKASNSEERDSFAESVAIDGDLMVIGADEEDGSGTGVNADPADNSGVLVGAAYVFARGTDGRWRQEAYLKASNAEDQDRFGNSVAISGNIVAVGAYWEDGGATGINGPQDSNSEGVSGAVYVFVRDSSGTWRQEAYLKAPNTDSLDHFGASVAMSGNTLVVGSFGEAGTSSGVDGNFNSMHVDYHYSGAAHVYIRSSRGVWSRQAYLKASNNNDRNVFGSSVAISGDTIVVGAPKEDSAATGVNGNPLDQNAAESGAAYVFVRNSRGTWSQQAYLKASNTEAGDAFGSRVAIEDDTLVVAAADEASTATGVGGDQDDNSRSDAGAAYVFRRDGSDRWSQEAYLKPLRTITWFATSVAVRGDLVAVGGFGDKSRSVGVDGDPDDLAPGRSGAVYLYQRQAGGNWTLDHYLKPANPPAAGNFGHALAISGDDLLVGDNAEQSSATGIDGDHLDESAALSGAAYLFDLAAVEPRVSLTSWERAATGTLVRFSGDQGVRGWRFTGSGDLSAFSDELPTVGPLAEPLPGHYEATLDLADPPADRYFLRIER